MIGQRASFGRRLAAGTIDVGLALAIELLECNRRPRARFEELSDCLGPHAVLRDVVVHFAQQDDRPAREFGTQAVGIQGGGGVAQPASARRPSTAKTGRYERLIGFVPQEKGGHAMRDPLEIWRARQDSNPRPLGS